MRRAQAGDTILLVSEKDRKCFIRMLEPGKRLETHRGWLAHDDLIGQPLGAQVFTQLGFPYYLLLPTTDELIRFLHRESQIIFPKDAGYIIMKLGIHPGATVIEAGTGSGGLCLALATIVGDEGRVYSYDVRPAMQEIARRNLERAGLAHRVIFRLQDALEGFSERDADAVFLDMLTPHLAVDQAREALRGSGVLGCIVPTVNQLVQVADCLHAHRGYGFVEADELLLRSYKTLPVRVRPDDRMVGHTGFLVFARAVIRPSGHIESEATPDGEESDNDQEFSHDKSDLEP